MSYELSSSGDEVVARLAASTREGLFRDAVSAGLSALYGGECSAAGGTGDFFPVQAGGDTDQALLASLLENLEEAARRSPGTLHPARWLSFDTGRVTANLPVGPSANRPKDLVPRQIQAGHVGEGIQASFRFISRARTGG